MSRSITTVSAVAMGALVVAVVALAVRPTPVVGAPATGDQPAVHSITVTGTGSVTLVPDTAHVGTGVTISRPTVKAARQAAADAMTAIIASIKALGIDEKDIQTTGINLNPQYSNASPPRVVGYTINEQIQVTVRDMDKAGDVVDSATANGATDVNGIWFDVADPAKAMNHARAAAVDAAKASAQAMASAAGVNIRGVISMSETQAVYPMPYAMGGAARAAADTATPVRPGTQDIQAQVTVVYEID